MKPAVALDAQLMYGTPTGIGEYLHGLIPALRAEGVLFDVLTRADFDPWRFDRRVIWDQLLLPLQARGYRLLHCTAGTMPLAPVGQATIVTVHDVAWLRVQQHARWYARSYFGAMMLHAYRRASAIVTVSSFSRDELLSFGNFDAARVHVVYPGVADDFVNLMRRSERPRDEPALILAVGTVERRKNLAVIVRALALMQNRRVRLIACGPPTPYLDECRALAARYGVSDRVEFRGYVARRELLDLYTRASVAVVPSIYEGFGLGAAQALVAGMPLVASATSSLNEIAAGATLLPPSDSAAWAHELDRIIADTAAENERAQHLRLPARNRFAWPETARALAALYKKVLMQT